MKEVTGREYLNNNLKLLQTSFEHELDLQMQWLSSMVRERTIDPFSLIQQLKSIKDEYTYQINDLTTIFNNQKEYYINSTRRKEALKSDEYKSLEKNILLMCSRYASRQDADAAYYFSDRIHDLESEVNFIAALQLSDIISTAINIQKRLWFRSSYEFYLHEMFQNPDFEFPDKDFYRNDDEESLRRMDKLNKGHVHRKHQIIDYYEETRPSCKSDSEAYSRVQEWYLGKTGMEINEGTIRYHLGIK